RGSALFDDPELDFVREAGPLLAEGARFGLRFGQAGEPDLPDAPGLILLDPTLRVMSATSAAGYWLKELGASLDVLPTVVTSVAGQARAEAGPAVARVLSESGRWLAVYGAKLEGADQVSVIIEPVQPTQLAPILMRAFGFTEREQDVMFCVLRGSSTAKAATALSISQETVQRHLTSIFDKTGVRSRGELLGLVFQAHYEPRVRDNERRTGTSRPSRDGPMPT
ncbi:MAG TPA: helix-turn-helix transcriptional regulator, partial [Nocardioidaceae bacterium]|nr:helix-turn-helix transcriptional regulator [Nocardioidaceae bacterium]